MKELKLQMEYVNGIEKDLFNEIGRKFNAEFVLSVVVILPLRLSVNDIFKR